MFKDKKMEKGKIYQKERFLIDGQKYKVAARDKLKDGGLHSRNQETTQSTPEGYKN